MVAFVTSIVVLLILLGGVDWYRKRTPADKDFTWGEAMLFATYVFFVLWWVYGVVPHQWLTWADSELNWRPDRYLIGPDLPFTMTYQVIRDLVAVVIYGIALGGNVVMWRQWQERGNVDDAPKPTSEYGRPLIREGAGT
jgi:amino acid transporter